MAAPVRAQQGDEPNQPNDPTQVEETPAPANTESEAEASARRPERIEAERRYAVAIERADAGDCELAVAEFEEIYRLIETPVVFFNMAICYEKLRRYDEAVAHYERYLEEAGPEGDERSEVERSLERLRAFLGSLVVASNVSAEVWVDDRKVGTAPIEIMVPAGSHSVELRAEGFEAEQQEVVVASGRFAELEFEHERLSDFDGIDRSWVFASGAAAVAMLLGAGVAGGMALSRGSIDGRPTVGPDVDRTRRTALTADVLYGAAGALAIATIVLATVADWDSGDDERVRVAPSASPSGFGVVVGARY